MVSFLTERRVSEPTGTNRRLYVYMIFVPTTINWLQLIRTKVRRKIFTFIDHFPPAAEYGLIFRIFFGSV